MNDRATDPGRLVMLATSESALLREDLRAVRGLGPTKEQLRALELAVGGAVAAAAGITVVAGATSSTISSTTLGGVASTSAAVATTAAPAAVASSAITFGVSAGLLKGGAGVLAVVLGVAAGRAWIAAPSTSARGGATTHARALGPVERPAAPSPRPVLRHAVEDGVASAGVTAPVVPTTVTTPEPSIERRSLAAERGLLDRAQRALGDTPAVALAATEAHRRRFRDGALAEEREVIAVGALVSLGRDDDARARAAAFARRYPGSAYARRMHDLVGPTGR